MPGVKRKYARLGRTSSHRQALLRTMVTQLIQHERITTTLTKAKALRRVADKMVTHGKKGNLHHRRLAAAYVRDRESVSKLFDELAPRYEGRPGGYTRVLRAGFRTGDNAPMAVIEWVDREGEIRPARPAPGRRGEAGGDLLEEVVEENASA